MSKPREAASTEGCLESSPSQIASLSMSAAPNSVSTATLEELGLYNLLTCIARGEADLDPFLLGTLRDKGFVHADLASLTADGEQALQGLTVKLGWFYPDV